jgi:hypothetical protein
MKLQVFLNVTLCRWVRTTCPRPCRISEDFCSTGVRASDSYVNRSYKDVYEGVRIMELGQEYVQWWVLVLVLMNGRFLCHSVCLCVN